MSQSILTGELQLIKLDGIPTGIHLVEQYFLSPDKGHTAVVRISNWKWGKDLT
ncbi:hypothetical protein E4U59_007880, partial [Claviceps monticola]